MSTYIQNFLKFRTLLSELVSRDIMDATEKVVVKSYI